MSTTAPNFKLVLATNSDVVNVTSHVSNNFSTIDSVMGAVHTGTGQLKNNVTIISPILASPSLSGTMSGGVISASTGQFNTVTATGGAITVNSLAVGTYTYPATIGATSQLLTVSGGNATWQDAAPNTGANLALSNLASVSVNTNLNNFTAGTVTFAKVVATAGTLTGMTSIVSTTGTFSGLNIVGTLNADACNFTGGTVKVASFSVGTYTYPNALATTGQVLSVVSAGTAGFLWNTRSPLVFSWVGCMTGSTGNGWGISFDNTTCGSVVALMCKTTAMKPVTQAKFLRVTGIDTVTFYALAKQGNDGIGTGRVKVAIGASTGTSICVMGSSAGPTWITPFDVDVSGLAANTCHDLIVSLEANDGGPWGTLVYSIQGFVKTG